MSMKLQKRLAASAKKGGKGRIWIDPNERNDISTAKKASAGAGLTGSSTFMKAAESTELKPKINKKWSELTPRPWAAQQLQLTSGQRKHLDLESIANLPMPPIPFSATCISNDPRARINMQPKKKLAKAARKGGVKKSLKKAAGQRTVRQASARRPACSS